MRIEAWIACKYFFPHNRDFFRRISLISIITVFISVFLPMLILGILNGFHQSLIQKMISKDFHVQVFDPGDAFFDYQDIIDNVERKFPGVQGFPYFEGGAILSYRLQKISALVRGVPPAMKEWLGEFRVVEGKWEFGRSAVVIGAGIAQKMGIRTGDIIRLYLRPYQKEGKDNQEDLLRMKRVLVSGIFRTGYEEIDSNLIFMPFDKARLFYNYGDRAWGVGFFVSDRDNIPHIRKGIKQLSSYLQVKDWEEINRNVLFSFEFEKNVMLVVLVVIIVATLFSVYIGLNVVVSDRKKEIGLLKLLGMTPEDIQTIFFFKGLLIGLIAIVLGTLFSFVILYNLRELVSVLEKSLNVFFPGFSIVSPESTYGEDFYFEWRFWDTVLIFGLNIVSILIATYFPVRRINRYTVSEAIRNV